MSNPVTYMGGADHRKVKARDLIAGWPKSRSTLPDVPLPWVYPNGTFFLLDKDAYHQEQLEMVEYYHRGAGHWLPIHMWDPSLNAILQAHRFLPWPTLESHIWPTYGGLDRTGSGPAYKDVRRRPASLFRGDFPWER